MNTDQMCSECGETHIKSLGYNYDLGKVFYECSNCEAEGDSSLFEVEVKKFSVATFELEDDSNAEILEGGLSWEEAVELAEDIFKTGDHYGVEIIDDDPNNTDPIAWIKTIVDPA